MNSTNPNSIKLMTHTGFSSRSLALGGAVDSFCRNQLFRKLKQIEIGRVEIVELPKDESLPTKSRFFGNPVAPPELRAKVFIRNQRAYSKIALGGSIGTGESYVDGDWECDELTSLIRVFVANRNILIQLDGGWGALLSPIQRFFHRLRGNTVSGSRENIHAHYDIGNDFFALFLDETWMYSCGVFEKPTSTLFEASTAKNDRICKKLSLSEKDHLLEIGTGWGGFAIHAAQNYGCQVTTTTISEEQFSLATQRVREAGLDGKITVLFQDYRDLKGQFDKIVSIEMIEAVGLDYLGTYFSKCNSLLKPDGQMLLQGITIRDQYFDYARKNVDFIQRYIFPGAGIPSIQSISQALTRESDLCIFHQEDIGPHYARTLRHWSQRLKSRFADFKKLGYPDELYRLWQFYLNYCEGGFEERSIGCSQLLLVKPGCRREPILGRI